MVRVPDVSSKIWSEREVCNLGSKVGTMGFRRCIIQIPVLRGIGWDHSGNNVIGGQFIMMLTVKGKKASNAWYDLPDGWKTGHDASAKKGKADKEVDEELSADFPPPELERRRDKILRLLAYIMADLSKVQFEFIGSSNFDPNPSKPLLGKSYQWGDYSGELCERAVLDSSCSVLESQATGCIVHYGP
jgi:hypothetical protein